MRTFILLALPFLLANGEAPKKKNAPLPPEVAAMLEAAMASGNEAELNTIAKYARKVAPDSSDAIARIAGDWRRKRQEDATRRLRESDFLELVRGRVELGAWITTGNTRNVGVNGLLDVKREGLNWRHKLRLQADYQESLGTTNRERYLAAYEPNYKIDDRAYIYGALQFESDRFLGYRERYTASTGAGYSAIKEPDIKLDLEVGPAYRYASLTNGLDEESISARGSLDLVWKLTPAITFDQDVSAYIENIRSTIATKSAIRARLLGPLSGQLSYAVQYESDPPANRVSTDTITRASLVYDF